MVKKSPYKELQDLPRCAIDFIKLVIKKMRYRKKVRAEVMAELTAHFEDELKDCKSNEEKEQKAEKLIADFGDVKLLGVLLRRAKKRCRPLWRTIVERTFQTIGILILFFVVYVTWFLTGKPVITTDYLAQLNQMVRPAADESLNAAPLYEHAIRLYAKSSDEISELLRTKYNEVTPEQKKLIAKWSDDNKEVFDVVIAGTQKPYYWRKYANEQNTAEMMTVLVPDLREYKMLARALCWRAHLRAEQGRYKDAFGDTKSCYRLGQHLKGDRTLIEQVIGISIESLAAQALRDILSEYEIDSGLLGNLQKDFEQIAFGEDFTVNLRWERLFVYDEIQRCFTEDRLGGGHLYIPRVTILGDGTEPDWGDTIYEVMGSREAWLGALHVLFTHPNKQETREMADRFYTFCDSMAHKTPAQIRAENIDLDNKAWEIVKGNLLLEILTPNFGRAIEKSYQIRAEVQALVTIIGLLRHKNAKGLYPENLQELITTGYLKELPMDLYSVGPLVYKRTHDSFLLYSLSENFKDDGGEVFRDSVGRARTWADEGDAVFWPVPIPETPEGREQRLKRQRDKRQTRRRARTLPKID